MKLEGMDSYVQVVEDVQTHICQLQQVNLTEEESPRFGGEYPED
jgi:hypothetical protein